MAVVMTNLGFQPKGRATIRRMTPSNRSPRYVEPWALQPKEGSMLAKLEAAYLSALESVDAVKQRKAEAVASKKFTDGGVAQDVLQFAASQLAPKLKRARQVVEAAKAEAAARRAKLALKPADKTDAAGQMRRLWKLDRFNAMPDAERNSCVAKGNLDPELVQGILEAPEYSKILPSDLDQIRDRALRAQHGDEAIAELRQLEEGIKIADDVVKVAREEVAQDVGGLAKLDAAAAPYEKAATAPWLRKYRRYTPGSDGSDEGVEIIGVWDETVKARVRPATEEEIANGVYYPNLEAYRRAQAGDVSLAKEKSNGGL